MTNDQRVLILAPLGRDGPVAADRLRAGGFAADVCTDAHDAARQVGAGAGTLLLTEEALEQAGMFELFAHLQSQPAWSELPLVILTHGGESRLPRLLDRAAEAARAITVLERPLGAATLLRTIDVALRSRRRQYQVRDLLEQERRQNVALQAARTAALNLSDDATRARDQAEQAKLTLEELNKDLEDRVEKRTEQLRILASRIATAQEEERRRIASGLHDSVCQLLAAIQLKIGMAQNSLDEEKRKELLHAADGILNDAGEEVRELIFELSSPALFEAGFVVAARNLCDQMSARTGVHVDLECADDELEVPARLRPGLYYNLRELLANVARHAGTDEASVRIETTNVPPSDGTPGENRLLRVVVRDHGKGFDAENFGWKVTRTGGFGLPNLRERMKDLGGQFHIRSWPGDGTEAVMEVGIGQ